MLSYSTVEWSVAQCVYDGLAGEFDVVRAATRKEGECEENEINEKVWSIYLIDYNRQAGWD